MRSVIYVLSAALVGLMWLNNSDSGRQILREMHAPSPSATRVYH